MKRIISFVLTLTVLIMSMGYLVSAFDDVSSDLSSTTVSSSEREAIIIC